MIRKHQLFFNVMQVSLDALFLLLAYIGSVLFKLNWTEIQSGYRYLIATLWVIPLLLIVYYFMGVYSAMRTRLYRKEALIITRAHSLGVVIIYSAFFLNKGLNYSRGVSLLFACIGLFLILLERY